MTFLKFRNKSYCTFPVSCFVLLMACVLLTSLSGCEEVSNPHPVGAFAGTYEVEDQNSYTLTISTSEVTPYTFQLANLANTLKQPVSAQAYGGQLTIPDQVVLGDDNTQFMVKGSGQLDGETLYLRFSIKGTSNFDGSVWAKKK